MWRFTQIEQCPGNKDDFGLKPTHHSSSRQIDYPKQSVKFWHTSINHLLLQALNGRVRRLVIRSGRPSRTLPLSRWVAFSVLCGAGGKYNSYRGQVPLPRVDINAQMFTVNLCKRFVLHAEIWFEEWFRFSFHTAVTLSWRTLSPAASWSVFAQRHYNGVVTWCEWWPLRTSLKKDQVKINNIFNEFVCSCSGIELEKLRTFVINLKKHVRI